MGKKITWHHSVNYVEPNDVNSIQYVDSNGVTRNINKAPKLEDFCISLGLEVELQSRTAMNINETDKKLTLIYSNSSSDSQRISFFKGNPLGGGSSSFLTSYYADMSSEDLRSCQNVEMLGIKSVDVEYENFAVPQITIVFTDVRGMSLLQPSEIDREMKNKAFADIDNKNVTAAFFRTFFMLPSPKFTIYLKGLYGQPVAYQMACMDFRTSFDSDRGDFDITVKFIGHTFSFLTEISVNALIAAPYSDYIGETYWKEKVSEGKFVLPMPDGSGYREMPTICELINDFQKTIAETNLEISKSDLVAPLKDNSEEIAVLQEILDLYNKWYNSLVDALNKKYGKVENGGATKAAVEARTNPSYCEFAVFYIPLNGVGITSMDAIYTQVLSGDKNFTEAHSKLITKIKEYNLNHETNKLTEISEDLHEFIAQPFIKSISSKKETENSLPIYTPIYEETIPFTKEEITTYKLDDYDILKYGCEAPRTRSHYYENGLKVIKIDISSKGVFDRLSTLSHSVTDEQRNEINAQIAKLQRKLIAKNMSWFPSIENFVKIMMAHLETLMKMMYETVNGTSGRTAESLGVSVGRDGTLSDVPKNDSSGGKTIIPPFPRVTREYIEYGPGGDEVKVRRDMWIGDVESKQAFIETNIVDGLLNGAKKVSDEMERAARELEESTRNASVTNDGNSSMMPFPITSFDCYLKKNPYGDDTETLSNIATFVGKVALRAYSILFASTYPNMFGELLEPSNIKLLGIIEADNFFELNRMTNQSIKEAILGGGLTRDLMIDIVTNNTSNENLKSYMINGKWPWNSDEVKALFNNSDSLTFLSAYKIDKDKKLIPLQWFDFNELNYKIKQLASGKITYAEENNMVYRMPTNNKNIFGYTNNTTSLYNYELIIDDNNGRVKYFLELGQTKGNEAYNTLSKSIVRAVTVEGVGEGVGIDAIFASFFISDGYGSFCGTKITKDGLPNERNMRVIKLDDFDASILLFNPTKYVENGGDIDDVDDDEIEYDLENKGEDSSVYSHGKSLTKYIENEKATETINTVFLTEVFNFSVKMESFNLVSTEDHILCGKGSLFTNVFYYDLKGWGDLLEAKYVKAAHFVMCLRAVKYGAVNKYLRGNFGMRSHAFLPRFVVLQLGAWFAAEYYDHNCFTQNSTIKSKKLPLPFEEGEDENEIGWYKLVNSVPISMKLSFIRSFKQWVDEVQDCLTAFEMVSSTTKDNSDSGKLTQVCLGKNFYWKPKNSDVYRAIFVDESTQHGAINKYARLLFNENNEYVKKMSNSLLRTQLLTYGVDYNVLADYQNIVVDKTFNKRLNNKIEDYLNPFFEGFLDRMKELLEDKTEETNNSNLLKFAQDPSKITIDMRVSLYLYLKQLYDKWIPSTTMEDWDFETFFGKDNEIGHQFHFIDSFYNKIGHKLMMNPDVIINAFQTSMLSPDWNAMLLPFMSDLFAKHHCSFKCIQNFMDITKPGSMDKMFKPVAYNEMDRPKRNPDFVVIYIPQPSSNLNLKNGVYEDDGFMLNDEADTPLAITTRVDPDGMSNQDNKGWYQLPAFGVVYGGQYQSYFKKIDINMDNPIATEQSIGAKFRIIEMSRHEDRKTRGTVAQDLYDVFSTRSYNCNIRMMGCAWVQPLMYFVLLNIPLFKGSYIIYKVSHKMVPGDMETTIMGCRMSRIATKIADELMTDDGNANSNDADFTKEREYEMASPNNDCDYKFYPIRNEVGTVDLSKDALEIGYQIMCYLLTKYPNSFTVITAAVSAANMRIESGNFKYTYETIVDTSGYLSGGLCMWHKGNLICATKLDYENYGCIKDKEEEVQALKVSGTSESASTMARINNLLKNGLDGKPRTVEQYLDFYVKSFKDMGGMTCWSGVKLSDFSSKTSIDSATEFWYDKYGRGAGAGHPESKERATTLGHVDYLDETTSTRKYLTRKGCAQKYYNYFNEKGGINGMQIHTTQPTQVVEKDDFNKLFFEAVKKTLVKSVGSSISVDNFATKTADNGKITFIKFNAHGKNYRVFDILLKTYVQYVRKIRIYIDQNEVNGDAKYLLVEANEKGFVKGENLTISVHDINGGKESYLNVSNNLSDEFYASLLKRYGNPRSNNKSDILYGMVDSNGAYTQDIIDGISKVSISKCKDALSSLVSKTSATNINLGKAQVNLHKELEKKGFKALPYSWDAVEEYDIVVKDGHIEILAVKANSPKDYGWGSVHDNNYNNDGKPSMPAYAGKDPYCINGGQCTKKTKYYQTIWRCTSNKSEWVNCVKEMGSWYEKNIHTYHGTLNSPRKGPTNYYCDLTNTNVRDDCSGFVCACLQRFGVNVGGYPPLSKIFLKYTKNE